MPTESVPLVPAQAENWREYWNQDEFWGKSQISGINADLFVRRASAIVKLSPQDKVLDFGCGAGWVAQLLAPRVQSFLGLDRSQKALDLAKVRCQKIPSAQWECFSGQGAVPESFEKFSLFLAVSVVQYFPDFESVVDLVEKARQAALPGGRMLIADIPQPRNLFGFFRDAFCSLIQSAREGYLKEFLWAACQAHFSNYSNFSARHKILEIPAEKLQTELQRRGFAATIIQENLSISAGRPSVLINF